MADLSLFQSQVIYCQAEYSANSESVSETAPENGFVPQQSNQDRQFESGAVRSNDCDDIDFTSIPLLGLIGVARTAGEGKFKYGRFNYLQGMEVWDLLNHAFYHLVKDLLGDREEPNLEHAAWGLLAAIQERALRPENQLKHELGPGVTMPPEMIDYLKAMAPILAERRKRNSGTTDSWKLTDIKDVKRILAQRHRVNNSGDKL